MSDIIAGSPAPTNPAPRERLVAKVTFVSDQHEADFTADLDAYRAQIRAEVLAEAIAAANAEYEAQDATAERSPYNEGVFDAVSALYRLLNGGAR